MCGLCGLIGDTSCWSDDVAAGAAAGNRRQARARMIRLANLVAGPSRVRISDWNGQKFLVSGPTGRKVLAANGSALWQAVDDVGGKKIDPLSPELLRLLDG